MSAIRTGPDWMTGSFTPLVTPFLDGEVDHAAFARAVERQIEGGSAGVVVTGTTGEPTSLSAEERLGLVRTAVTTASGRIPVVAATGTFRQDESVWLTKAAADAGAAAVMVVSPGFVKPTADGLARYFEAVLGAVRIPALLYNIPGRAGVTITPDVVARVVESSPNLMGVKTASPDLDYVTELLLRHGPGFRIFCGLESYTWPMMAIGAAGVMSAVANLVPGAVAELCQHARAGRIAEARSLHDRLFEVNRAIFFETNPGPLKTLMSLRGEGSAELRPPLAEPSPAVRERLADVLSRLSAQVAS